MRKALLPYGGRAFFTTDLLEGSISPCIPVALAAVACRTCTLFGVAADAEFVGFLLVYAELARRSLMALGAGVQSHMLRVVEVDIAVVCLENLGFDNRAGDACQ